CAATKQLGFSLRYERPGHGFKQSARRKRSLSFARAILNGSENGFAGLLSPETSRWHTVNADNTHELLDDIGTAVNVWPPGWHGDFHALALAGDEKAEFFQYTPQVRKLQFQPGESWKFAKRKIDDLFLRRRIAGDSDFRRFAAAE